MKTRPIVIKIGGSTFGSSDTTVQDLVALQKQGMDIVVVHGGGALITQWLKRQAVSTSFIHGLRVTDAESLKVVTAVLSGLVNKELVCSLQKAGARAAGISGVDGCMVSSSIRVPELGFTGEVDSVDCSLLNTLLEGGYLTVISPVCYFPASGVGEPLMLNLNGDSVTGEMAIALGAEMVIFLTDVPGVKDSRGDYLKEIKTQQAEDLIYEGVAAGGMEVKLRACIKVAQAGGKAYIIDGRRPHALQDGMRGKVDGTSVVK